MTAGSAARAHHAPSPAPEARPTPASELRAHVVAGLGGRHRELSPKYFYDDAGAALFDRICTLDAYYLTRTEIAIHREHAAAIAAGIGPNARLVEFGSGSGTKTKALLGTLDAPAGYAPVDICQPQLATLAAEIAAAFPSVDVTPVYGDFSSIIALPAGGPHTVRTVALCHGSTIGNLHPGDAGRFLARTATLCGPGAGMLVGVDLTKERAPIERAYNDPEGVTAAFNMNLLRRINRECGANFDLRTFTHRAFYDEPRRRVEMRLISSRDQIVSVPADGADAPVARFHFRGGDYITTEYSYKYDAASFGAIAARAGWDAERVWTDDREWFAVWLLRTRSGAGAA